MTMLVLMVMLMIVMMMAMVMMMVMLRITLSSELISCSMLLMSDFIRWICEST